MRPGSPVRRVVDRGHGAGDRGVDLGGGLDALDHRGLVALLELLADLGELDEDDVAELVLRRRR